MYLPMIAVVALASLLVSCHDDTTAPAIGASATPTLEGTLTPVGGSGSGRIAVSPLNGTTVFSARVSVELIGVMPNSSYHLEHAPEVGRPLSENGIGERAAEMWPWQQPNCPGFPDAAAFLDAPCSIQGLPVAIATDGHGIGSAELTYSCPNLPVGSRFDVVFRVLEDSTPRMLPDTLLGLATELRSDCFTLPSK